VALEPQDSSQAAIAPLASKAIQAEGKGQSTFRVSPLIRLTLFSLYLALTIPLPFLSQLMAAVSVKWLMFGICIGSITLYAALSEQVVLDQETIRVTYPAWVPRWFRKGWSLRWIEIQDLKPRSTGQGGLVYYLCSTSGQAYLLPMRVVGFARLVQQVQAKTGINTTTVRPLAQAWMYLVLLGFTCLLLLFDGWVIWTATTALG